MAMKKTIISILIISLVFGTQACKKNEPEPVDGIKVGNVAPDFTLPDVNSNNVSLSDYKGQLVLVEFWASWCSYCKAENPELVALYDEYKDRGFNILAVSLDTQKSKWIGGIESENLDYDHVSDLKGFDSPVADMYAVSSIPQLYLVDENGIIILITTKASDVAASLEQYY